jgi:hypothetical protein
MSEEKTEDNGRASNTRAGTSFVAFNTFGNRKETRKKIRSEIRQKYQDEMSGKSFLGRMRLRFRMAFEIYKEIRKTESLSLLR